MTEKKELSFLDLFLVLVRYRKLVVLPALIFCVFFGIFLFVIPKIFPSQSKGTVEVVCSVKVEPMSLSLSSYLNMDITNLAIKNLEDYINFSKVQKKYNIWTSSNLSEREYNAAIKNLIKTKAFLVEKETKENIRLTTTVSEDELSVYYSFINEYIQYCSDIIDYQVESLVDSAEKNIAQMVDRYGQSGTASADISSLLSMQLEFQNYRKSHKHFLQMNGTPFETSVGKGRIKKLIICTFAVFVLSVLLAFLLNLVSQIKADPEKSKLVSDAWKAGK